MSRDMGLSGQSRGHSGRFYRLNCSPGEAPLVDSLLQAEGFESSTVPFSRLGRVLEHGPRPLGSSLAAFFGLIYIQDKSSFLPGLCLAPEPGEAVLDMCASPGSKTGVLSQLVGPRGGVVANEPNTSRLQTLRRNVQVLNLVNAACSKVSGQDIPDIGPGRFHILCDVPCSGWGTVDRHPKVKSMWTAERIGPLLELQQQILDRAAEILQPGSRLLYSTCTTNVLENEDQVLRVLGNRGLILEPLTAPEGIAIQPLERPEAAGCLRVDGPGSGGQSFFLGCLRRPGDGTQPEAQQDRNQGLCLPESLGPGLEGRSQSLLDSPACWENLPPGRLHLHRDQVVFLPAVLEDLFAPALKMTGFPLGRMKKGRFSLSQRARTLIPAQGGQDGLDLEDARTLQRLVQGQSLQVGPKGKLVPLFWRGLALGWLSVKGRRGLWTDRG
jgi:16S rRNA (cytosine1407-C5)-methyltransferase